MKGSAAIFGIVFVLIVVAVIGLVVILNYNGLVVSEKNVDEAEAQIATVCQRRLDLLPNLIETVKGYAAHEKSTLVAVTEARAKAQGALKAIQAKGSSQGAMAQVAATQAGLTTAMRGIFALVENYPNLRASSNFMALQDQFEGTENRITVARQRYNSAVRYYNAKIETFPGVVLAPMFGFSEKEYYEVPDQKAYEPVKVKF